MQRIKSALQRHKKKLFGMKNVVGVGIGYKEDLAASTDAKPQMGVVVLVKEKVPESELESQNIIPKKIDGVVTEVIEVGELRLLAELPRTGRGIVPQPGVSIGHYKITAGTFGAVVKDRQTGEKLILSNNHVLANGSNGNDRKAKLGDPILLPGPHDGGLVDKDIVGRLHRFKPVSKTYTQSTCPKAAAAEICVNAVCKVMAPAYSFRLVRQATNLNKIDAALAKPVDPNALNSSVMGLGKIKGMVEAKPGMVVRKSGRTTGVTDGVVQAVHVTVQVEMGDGEMAEFHDQIVATPMSQGGDSGSIVLNEDNQAVGLLFAGSDKSTVFNRIQNVMEELDITF